MKKEVFYVKSLEEDFISKTLRAKKKVDFQSIEDIIKTKKINPNTKSFGKKSRLACTALSKNYTKTYRQQGIIFKTKDKPDYVSPFDLILLTKTNKIIVQYYRIKNNLHQYYNQELISGFEKFICKTAKEMLEKFPSPETAWKEVNKFRVKNGYKLLPKQKYRLVEYNEVIFHNPVKITPIALYGYRKNSREIARKLRLPHFISAKKFYESIKQQSLKSLTH
ncbi:hypothetical protein HN604_01460 [archaeon]|jgi:hypothetical protein|nr:hypothetical protein [archaeon]MBT6182276.1 hypothetical protein [archaeon]MBT6606357.1 hypothetical protein [archaeon]MBT7251474.1 hypothetical protein [archaeon]MBT7660730.1 hypothetical protein [archaeon]